MQLHLGRILVPLKIRLHILLESLPVLAPRGTTLKEGLTVAVCSHSLRLYTLENYPACTFPENRSWQIVKGGNGILKVRKLLFEISLNVPPDAKDTILSARAVII